MYEVTLRRDFSQQRNQTSGLEYIRDKALVPFRNKWVGTIHQHQPAERHQVGEPANYIYTATIRFEKRRGHSRPELVQREWLRILGRVQDACTAAKFHSYPWRITEATDREQANIPQEEHIVVANGEAVTIVGEGEPDTEAADAPLYTRHVIDEAGRISFDEFKTRAAEKIDLLLRDDDALSDNLYFKDIFGRNPQIRTVLSSVKSFLDTNGQRRNHTLLYGLPACAKTQILRAVASFLGQDAVLKLDASATSPAGIYKLFFDELDIVPPIVVLEEVEKANEEGLKVWLGALDDRGELRKINYREMKVREVRVLCLATVNDKEKFDSFMGGSATKPGPLSSRFVHQLKCPRPDREIMRRILYRDINNKGGREAWVEPALRLADAIETNDPRRVLGLLDGGDRLLTGEYQKDVLTIEGKTDLLERLAQ